MWRDRAAVAELGRGLDVAASFFRRWLRAAASAPGRRSPRDRRRGSDGAKGPEHDAGSRGFAVHSASPDSARARAERSRGGSGASGRRRPVFHRCALPGSCLTGKARRSSPATAQAPRPAGVVTERGRAERRSGKWRGGFKRGPRARRAWGAAAAGAAAGAASVTGANDPSGRRELTDRGRDVRAGAEVRDQRLDFPLALPPRLREDAQVVLRREVRRQQPHGAEVQGLVREPVEDDRNLRLTRAASIRLYAACSARCRASVQ